MLKLLRRHWRMSTIFALDFLYLLLKNTGMMKKIILPLVLIFAFFSCKQKEDNSESALEEEIVENVEKKSLDGVWELVSFYNFKDNKIVDTVMNNVNNRQVKMFLDGKVMWSRRAPDDKIDYFGYGAYEITDSTLTETLDYGSVAMLKVIDTMRVFDFELIMGKDTFTQIDHGPEGDRIYSENYVRIKN